LKKGLFQGPCLHVVKTNLSTESGVRTAGPADADLWSQKIAEAPDGLPGEQFIHRPGSKLIFRPLSCIHSGEKIVNSATNREDGVHYALGLHKTTVVRMLCAGMS
jgi:hypothetical protein